MRTGKNLWAGWEAVPLFIETIKSLPSLQRPGPVGRDGKRQSSNKIAASTHARILTSGGYINKRRGCAGADKVRTCSHLHVGKNTAGELRTAGSVFHFPLSLYNLLMLLSVYPFMLYIFC